MTLSRSTRARRAFVLALAVVVVLGVGLTVFVRQYQLRAVGGSQSCAPQSAKGQTVVMVPIVVKNSFPGSVRIDNVESNDGHRVSDFFTIPLKGKSGTAIPAVGSHEWPTGRPKTVGSGQEAMIALKFVATGQPVRARSFTIHGTGMLGIPVVIHSDAAVAIDDNSLCS